MAKRDALICCGTAAAQRLAGPERASSKGYVEAAILSRGSSLGSQLRYKTGVGPVETVLQDVLPVLKG